MKITRNQLRKIIAETINSNNFLLEGPSEKEVRDQLKIKDTQIVKFKLQKPGQGIKRVKDKLSAACKRKGGQGSPKFKTVKIDDKVYIVCIMDKK